MKYILVVVFICISALASEIKDIKIQNIEIDEIKDFESKNSMQKWLDGGFGLEPNKANYILPFGYSDLEYRSYVLTDEYKKYEAELQVSLKLRFAENLLGLNERYYASYTHQAFWQLYAESAPFRETTYNPEVFVIFPISGDNSFFNTKSIKLAFAHKSNGQGNIEDDSYEKASDNPDNRSRSINYIYTEFSFQHDTLITELTLWIPIPENENDNDNPDLMDYTGFSSVKFNYFYNKHMFTLMGRGNIETKKGAIETTYSHPFVKDIYFYAKIFSGYGETLADYNNYKNKFSVGFSFSR